MRKFEFVKKEYKKHPTDTILPTRSTHKSAGYDFVNPIEIKIYPQQQVLIWTDVKAYMEDDEVLMIYMRSSLGNKKGLILTNGTRNY